MARQGKIARLPSGIRRQLNERLRDGALGPEVLAWLNALPEVQAVLKAHFEGADIEPANLTNWRQGGYLDYLKESDREDRIRNLADYAARLASASGGQLSAGAQAIAAGRILEVFELAASGEAEDLDLGELVKSLSALHGMEIDQAKLALQRSAEERQSAQLALARDKFEAQTVDKFIDWAKSEEARKILDSGKPRHIQAAQLRQLMFGD